MRLYHTSNIEVKEPDISFSRTFLDFGKGFYTTPSKIQAEKYANRFFKQNLPAVLNTYEFDKNLNDISWHTFATYDGNWLDYVVACRRNQEHVLYDVVEGGIRPLYSRAHRERRGYQEIEEKETKLADMFL